MKKINMFLWGNRISKFGFVLLLMFSYAAFANGNISNENSNFGDEFLNLSIATTQQSAAQTAAHQATSTATKKLQLEGKKPAKAAAKKETKTTVKKRGYDKIDDAFKGIGPGNNTIPFIIALLVFLVAFGGIIKMKGKKKYAFVLVALIAFGFISKIIYTEARALGRQQGYAPVQPIWFSHEVHATQNGIDCEYCHVDARTGRHAGVPSLEVCMNCHTQVKEGSISGKQEIAKIYEHLGYNPETMQYDKPAKPIEWVKVHNLPDHVYFNHAQHVQAGKVACQECHGPVEKMNRVVEYEEFAMGDFCLKCHRERGIDTSNPYYKHYKFKDMKEGDKITVDKIGGADCSSCHY